MPTMPVPPPVGIDDPVGEAARRAARRARRPSSSCPRCGTAPSAWRRRTSRAACRSRPRCGPASVIRPSTSVTSAPYSSHSRMKGTLTSFGMKTLAVSPGGGGVGGHRVGGVAGGRNRQRRRAEERRPGHRGGEAARLEGVGGIERLVLDEQARQPEVAAEPRRVDERRPAFAERQRLLAVEERHQLAIPPHVRLARGQRLLLPRARRLQIVAGEQRHPARCRDAARLGDRSGQRRTGRCIRGG